MRYGKKTPVATQAASARPARSGAVAVKEGLDDRIFTCVGEPDDPAQTLSPMNDPADHRLNRRTFLARSAAALAATSVVGFPMIGRGQAVPAPLKLALVGCGGRGAGAANQALTADDYTELVAVADLFPDKLAVGLKSLQAAHSKSPSRWMPVASRRAQRHFPHAPSSRSGAARVFGRRLEIAAPWTSSGSSRAKNHARVFGSSG